MINEYYEAIQLVVDRGFMTTDDYDEEIYLVDDCALRLIADQFGLPITKVAMEVANMIDYHIHGNRDTGDFYKGTDLDELER